MLILKVFRPVHERTITKKDGTEFKVRFQEAELLQDGRRPRIAEVPVPSEGHYEEGLYTASVDSFRTNHFDRLELRFLSLLPLNEAIEMSQKAVKGS